jgi:two-component system, LytTR family, response regulator
MMLQCIAVDDEPHALLVLEEYFRDCKSAVLLHTFTNPITARAYIEATPPDLVFLDIEMPYLRGIELVTLIPPKTQVVFTSAHSRYAIESYELDVTDYLLKPFSYQRFYKALAKAEAKVGVGHNRQEQGHIYIRCNNETVRINLAEVLYIESQKDYVMVHTQSKKYLTLMTLKALEDILPAQVFCRIHKSYIVSLDQIVSILRKSILVNGAELPVGGAYHKQLLAKCATIKH